MDLNETKVATLSVLYQLMREEMLESADPVWAVAEEKAPLDEDSLKNVRTVIYKYMDQLKKILKNDCSVEELEKIQRTTKGLLEIRARLKEVEKEKSTKGSTGEMIYMPRIISADPMARFSLGHYQTILLKGKQLGSLLRFSGFV